MKRRFVCIKGNRQVLFDVDDYPLDNHTENMAYSKLIELLMSEDKSNHSTNPLDWQKLTDGWSIQEVEMDDTV